jgi:hypothetical protein
VKRNRFVTLTGASKSVNRALEAKARSLAGIKAYVTNLDPAVADADFVIGAYHRLFQIEKSSGCPSTTCRPARSSTTNARASRRT